MLTVNNSPTDYNLARNRNYVQVTTDNYSYSVNNGLTDFTGMFYANNAVVGNVIGFAFGVTNLLVTFDTTTNISLGKVAIIASGQTVPDYMVQFLNDLNQFPFFYNNYYLSAYYNSIYIEAKLPGTAYILSIGSTVSGLYYTKVRIGTDNFTTLLRDNYKIQLELFAETQANSNTYNSYLIIQKEPSNNVIKADLGPIIETALGYYIPDFQVAPYSIFCLQLCKKFYVKFSEIFGIPPAVQTTTISPSGILNAGTGYETVRYASLKGGLNEKKARLINTNQFAIEYYDTRFLTKQPTSKKISRNQIEWLYFIFSYDLVANACMKFEVENIYGQTTITYDLYTSPGVKQNNVWAFNVNNPLTTVLANPNNIKLSVSIYDLNTTSVISAKQEYIVDDTYTVSECFLFFINSDGGMDSVRLTGAIEQSNEFDLEIAERTRQLGDPLYIGDAVTQYAKSTHTFKVWSGWKTKEELYYIEDLFLSRLKFTIDADFFQIPIVITNKKYVVNKTNNNLFAYVIEYYETLSSELS